MDNTIYFYQEDKGYTERKNSLINKMVEAKGRDSAIRDLKGILEMSSKTQDDLKQVISSIQAYLAKLQPDSSTNYASSPKKRVPDFDDSPKAKKSSGITRMKKPKPPKIKPLISKPITAYFIFLQRNRQKVQEAYPELSSMEIANVMGQIWNSMSPSDKQVYFDEYRQNMEKYNQSLKEQ